MAGYVYDIPSAEDLCIVIGDDYVGATLTLSQSPGTGVFFANLENSKGVTYAFDVTINSPTEVVISMTDPATRRLKAGRHTWSLLFRDTTVSPTVDRTICHGSADVVDYPTSKI